MAPPHGEAVVTSFPTQTKTFSKPPKLANENLKRTVSDIAFELSKEIDREIEESKGLAPISEAEDAKCECCGMSEEYTPEYIKRVREKYLGKWICGLCSEAVKEEMEKNGGDCKEALDTHMSHCSRFNKLGRAYPVLCQAQAMREIFKKNSNRVRAKSLSPRDHLKAPIKKGSIARSSSCMPSMMNELSIDN
ncbi:Run domain Beclin-1-interacting and cysteine-rich domain-containing protein [Bienertia sinuspersici]